MNLPAIFAFSSAIIAALYFLLAPFGKRNSIPKWVFSFGMLALAIEQSLSGFIQITEAPQAIATLAHYRFRAMSFLPGLWILFTLTYSRGNVSEIIRSRLLLILIAFLIPIGLSLLNHGQLVFFDSGLATSQWEYQFNAAGFSLHIIFLISMIIALVLLEQTYRASVGTLRWRIKFMLYGLGTLFAARFFTSSQIILLQKFSPTLETINAVALLLACALIARSLLRPGSFEIDLYPSQKIISGSVVITIAGVYLVTVGLLSKVIERIGGSEAFALQTFLVLVSLVGLGLLIQSDRARQLIRRFVSRNFQRPLYDYRTLWLKVSEATSQSIREADICASTVRMLATLFDTKLTNVWLLDASESEFILTAASDLENKEASTNNASTLPAKEISQGLLSNIEPHSIERSEENWARAILEANPSTFPDGGDRIIVPLTGRGAVVGFMILGDRTNTIKFSQQEFDTLTCIGNHISATLLSAALTHKLEENKEIEAFQTMATFFVHDLKNAVSTLNLMLKNMPLHWDNPEFREDALRGIGNTSTRITDLITRLSQVRHELDLNKKPIPLQEIVQAAISEWEKPIDIAFASQLESTAPINGDLKKLKSVVLNLLINASEAMEASGSISLSLQEDGGELVLHVVDDGPGMSADFIRNSLFRPFKTTKKSGLGIGMFQSKMVVEAHGGKILVESALGKGASFTLRFPILSSIEREP